MPDTPDRVTPVTRMRCDDLLRCLFTAPDLHEPVPELRPAELQCLAAALHQAPLSVQVCLPTALSQASTDLLAFRSVFTCFSELLSQTHVLSSPAACF